MLTLIARTQVSFVTVQIMANDFPDKNILQSPALLQVLSYLNLDFTLIPSTNQYPCAVP